MGPPPPPPPCPPPPTFLNIPPLPGPTNRSKQPNLPAEPDVPATGPPNALLVSLLIYNGWPFADHWEYFIASPTPSGPGADNDVGVVIQAAGDVRAGFWLEVKRGWSLRSGLGERDGKGSRASWRRVPLGWVDGKWFEPVGAVLGFYHGGDAEGEGSVVVEGVARCEFERVLFRVPAPGKTLRSVGEEGEEDGTRTKITQRNCQTWVVESAEQLVREGIFEQKVVEYLRATSVMMPKLMTE